MSGRLDGRLALVTGASSGIGQASAAALAQEGAKVLATGREEDGLRALNERCRGAAHEIEIMAGDLNEAAFIRALASAGEGADILVNCAGILTYAPILEITDEECEAMFRTNVLSTFALTRRIAAAMAARGRGQIIMMTSLAAREVYRFGSVYCATKHALTALCDGLRLELQVQGVKVHEIAPGMVATKMRDHVSHPAVLAAVAGRPYEPLTADEVAQAVVFTAAAPENTCLDLIELRPRGSA
jgi:NADP-dependent 3-hydroxy acid dehydrogenase YdfG